MHEENPYASPEISSPAESHAGIDGGRLAHGPPFESGHTRAVWATTLLALGMLLNATAIGSTMMQISLLERAQRGAIISADEAESNDARQDTIGGMQMGVLLACVISFLMWFHRAHRNLPSLAAARLSYSPGWAVGGFFVPFLNLARPYQVMKEIWQNSDPADVAESSSRRALRSSSAIVGWWWAIWLFGNFTGQFAISTRGEMASLDQLIFADKGQMVTATLMIVAALLLILIIRRVDRNQQERHALLAHDDRFDHKTLY